MKIWCRIVEYCQAQWAVQDVVEVDESDFGPKRIRGKRGRGAGGKPIVFSLFK